MSDLIKLGAGLLSGGGSAQSNVLASAHSKVLASATTTTDSPSWIVVLSTTTQPVNTLRFNWSFAAAGEGFLRVFVDGNLVREIDQRYVSLASLATEEIYIGGGAGTLAPGIHRIAFRLDGFGTSASGVELTNVELGLVTAITPAAPVINSVGTASGTVNQSFSYQITATNDPTSYGASGLPAGLSVNTSTGLISGTPTASGTFTVTVTATNAVDTGSMSVTITIAAPASRLTNISTRGRVETGDNVMIGGFVIASGTPKTVLITARGPSLSAYGVPGVLANPVLQLYSGQTVIASNDNWGDATNASAIQATGMGPTNPLESAILTTLNPGNYTAIVSGAGGTSGVGIVEAFEVDNLSTPLINLSTRGPVQTGDNVMIGGFIITGSSPQTVLIRARGPSLSAYGVPDVLANPVVQLFSGQTVIASNDNWQSAANAAAIQATGLAPVSPFESAILITLPPGAYTAIVTGANGGTGVGIVEVFAQ